MSNPSFQPSALKIYLSSKLLFAIKRTYVQLHTQRYLAYNGESKAEKQFLYIYDLNGKKLQSFDLDKYVRATVFGSDNRYIYLTSTSQKNENTCIHQYWKIDKSQVPAGNAKMEEYFNMSEQIEP